MYIGRRGLWSREAASEKVKFVEGRKLSKEILFQSQLKNVTFAFSKLMGIVDCGMNS